MKDLELIQKIREFPKKNFSITDLEKILSVKKKSLRTVIMRLKNKGVLNQITRGWYSVFGVVVTPEEIVNQIYYPSYLSLKTVLSKAGIVNQIPRQIYCITPRKSYKTKIVDVSVIYRQIKKELYFGYYIENDLEIAYPEKALLDLLYFVSLGREAVSLNELDISRINKKRWMQFKKIYPKKTENLINSVEKMF